MIVIIGVCLIVLFGLIFGLKNLKKERLREEREISINETDIIRSEHITYILKEIGASQLHSPPFSREKPRIKFEIDGKIFTSVVVDGKIITKNQDIGEEDLKFLMGKKAVVEIINSENKSQAIRELIEKKEISLEIKADKKTLFLKGYLSLYKKLAES